MSLKIYGIKNCDTMKKAMQWLDNGEYDYDFHDYKKHGITKKELSRWCESVSWKVLLNTRGTTWRKLSDEQRTDVNKTSALSLMHQNPSLIKRPVLTEDSVVKAVGFSKEKYEQLDFTD